MQITEQHKKLTAVLENSPFHMAALRAIREINLPDCWVGAGFVRNYIWDHLHGKPDITPLNDIDVIYFDPGDISKEIEKKHDAHLAQLMPNQPWSVKNQSRMWQTYGDTAYANTEDGLRHWTEKATAVAVRLNHDDAIEILAPFGLQENFDLVITPTPHAETRPDMYNKRIQGKNWLNTWPKVQIKWHSLLNTLTACFIYISAHNRK